MKSVQILLVASLGAILVSGRSIQEEKRFIKVNADMPGQWMTQKQIFELTYKNQNFIDVTDYVDPQIKPDQVNVAAIPTTLKYQATVANVLTKLNGQRIQDFVREFSSYHNRYYSSQTGRSSQLWLLDQVEKSVVGYSGNASVFEVDHGYLQKSVVARLQGSDSTLASEVVILGAHLDSVNRLGATLNAPGADDNGSGSVMILEVLRTIVETGLKLKRTVEFQWYAAEEIGLRGSGAIAKNYKDTGVNVVGMLNIDVGGYYTSRNVGVFTDNANAQLVQFLRIIADEYVSWGRQDKTCGYGCSDHASFTNQGFVAVMLSEPIAHPQMHTVQDNFASVNFEQVNEFVKASVGFAVELAEPAN